MLVNLIAEIDRFQIPISKISKTIEKSERATKNRIYGSIEISSDDIRKIRDVHFPHCSLDYLLDETPCLVIPIANQKSAS